MTIFVAIVCGVLGLAVGSFLNVVIWRVPRRESVVSPPSHCPSCNAPLAPYDNIPVVSWVALKARCRHCEAPISPRYPAVELFTALCFAAIGVRFHDAWVLPAYLVFTAGLIALSLIDLEHYLLPNRVLYPVGFVAIPLLGVGALVEDAFGDFVRALLAGVVAFAIFFVIHTISPRGMGFGDVRLSFLLGCFLGYLSWWHVAFGLLAGFIYGAVVGVALMALGKRGRSQQIPFGPFLAAGAFTIVVVGQPFIDSYRGYLNRRNRTAAEDRSPILFRVLRFLTAGESHGPALVVTVEGLPAGLPILLDDVAGELARRRLGYGRGPRMRFEQDEIEFLGGVRHGRTLGSPVAIVVHNSEWATGKWTDEMASAPGRTEKPLTQPRPGHADLAGMQKYGFDDARDVLERASARETAARVAAGALAKQLLGHLDIAVLSHVVQLGTARAAEERRPGPDDLAAVDASEVRCFDADAEHEMIRDIKEAAKAGDSLGGVVEVLGYGVPPGLGSHVHWDRRIDALLAQALMSIQAMKAVEIGSGIDVAGRRGSEAHDAISWSAEEGAYRRTSTRAGGIEGGMTTGDLLVARVAMKPLATLNRPVLQTVDVETKEATVSFKERTDVTAVPAAGVVAETMVALVLASEALRKFGGDSLTEFVRNHDAYRASLS